jgi:hypothetical protein
MIIKKIDQKLRNPIYILIYWFVYTQTYRKYYHQKEQSSAVF